MEKEQRGKSQSNKDDLYSEDGANGIDTADHDQLTHIPSGERKNETGEELMSDVFRFAGKDDQTEDEIHGKGKSCGEGQNVHRSPVQVTLWA
jgi:hypothetical protein